MFYVINLEDNKGFAIMAANPAIPELLAISDNGNLDLASPPDYGVADFVRRIGDIFLPIDTTAHELGEIYTVATPLGDNIQHSRTLQGEMGSEPPV